MVHLRLTGVSEDGRMLLFVSDAGVEFTVDVDDRLRAALNERSGGDQPRLAQLEMQMDSTLRPRDIQARIRSGETPESVAQVAGTSVDKVMPYAAPVLAERAHVAQRAQRASIRRRPTESGGAAGARTLGEAVGSHLRGRNVDPDTVSWDAWRREDGRWTLTGSYTTGDRVGAAHFSFDAPGNYVVAEDDDAHWLLGEVADAPVADEAGPRRRPVDGSPAPAVRRTCRGAAAGRGRPRARLEDPAHQPALEMAPETVAARAEETAALGAEAPLEAYLDEPPAAPDATSTAPSVPDPAGESDEPDDSTPRRRPPARAAVAQAGEEDAWPCLGAELGRDHVRGSERRRPRVARTRSGCSRPAAPRDSPGSRHSSSRSLHVA